MAEPDPLDWLDGAVVCLKDHWFDEAGQYLAAAPALLDRLERAVALLETMAGLRLHGLRVSQDSTDVIRLIAEHRGEEPKETLARLRLPPPEVTFDLPEEFEAGHEGETVDEMIARLRPPARPVDAVLLTGPYGEPWPGTPPPREVTFDPPVPAILTICGRPVEGRLISIREETPGTLVDRLSRPTAPPPAPSPARPVDAYRALWSSSPPWDTST